MFKIIAAVADNGLIGNAGQLPWRQPDDMRWFKERTGRDPVVMGRKTFMSLPSWYRPLPDRENIILTRQRWTASREVSNVTFVENFDRVLERSKNEDIWVIGGAEVYALALPHAFEMYLTRVHTEVEGDTFFPPWNPSEWMLGWEHHRDADERHAFAMTWQIYFRKTPIYQFANTRTHEQRKVMLESLSRQECPFCPEGLGKVHTSPVIWQGKYWIMTFNDYPYNDSKHHLLIIPILHVEDLWELPAGAWQELQEVASLLKNKYDIDGGALTCRFGNPLLSGSTIKHLHFHVIEPERGKMVSFPVGCYPLTKITPP